MTAGPGGPVPTNPATALAAAAQATTPWGRLFAVLGVLGFAFSWYAQNMEMAGPALSSPVAVVLSHFAAVGAGMAIDHFMVSRPMTAELRIRLTVMDAEIKANKLLLDDMRKQERENLEKMGAKTAEIASLQTSVKYLQSEIDELREGAAPAPKRKRPRKPDPT